MIRREIVFSVTSFVIYPECKQHRLGSEVVYFKNGIFIKIEKKLR